MSARFPSFLLPCFVTAVSDLTMAGPPRPTRVRLPPRKREATDRCLSCLICAAQMAAMVAAMPHEITGLQATGLPAPASLLSLVFSCPLIESVPQHLHLLRAVHRTPENALYKVQDDPRAWPVPFTRIAILTIHHSWTGRARAQGGYQEV